MRKILFTFVLLFTACSFQQKENEVIIPLLNHSGIEKHEDVSLTEKKIGLKKNIIEDKQTDKVFEVPLDIEIENIGTDSKISIGTSGATIGEFRIKNKLKSYGDAQIISISFIQKDSPKNFVLENKVENLNLQNSQGKIISESVKIEGNKIVFKLSRNFGFIEEENTFYIKADIVEALKGDETNFQLHKIIGIDTKTGKNLKFNKKISLSKYSLKQGLIRIEKGNSNYLEYDVSRLDKDLVLLDSKVVVDQPILLEGIKFEVVNMNYRNLEDLKASFKNFRLAGDRKVKENDDGETKKQQWVLYQDVFGKIFIQYSGLFELAGTSKLMLVGDFTENNKLGRFIQLKINEDSFINPTYIHSGESVEIDSIVGELLDTKIKVKKPVLKISKDYDSLEKNVVNKSKNVQFLDFNLEETSSVGAVRVKRIKLKILSNKADTDFSNFKIVVAVPNANSRVDFVLDKDGTLVISDINEIIKAGDSIRLNLFVDIDLDESKDLSGLNLRAVITDIVAESVLDGTRVDVLEDGKLLGQDVNDSEGDGDCKNGTKDNYLCGIIFHIEKEGTLFLESDRKSITEYHNFGNILLEGEVDSYVYMLKLKAEAEDIEITDVYFKVENGNNLIFHLYDKGGAFLQATTSNGGNLHFKLPFYKRIELKAGESDLIRITVVVQPLPPKSIGKVFNIKLDESKGQNGLKFLTSTGKNKIKIKSKIEDGLNFIIYKNKLNIDPLLYGSKCFMEYTPNKKNIPIYRFKVGVDNSREDAKLTLYKLKVGIEHSSDVKMDLIPGSLRLLRYKNNSFCEENPVEVAIDSKGFGVFNVEEIIEGDEFNYYEIQLINGFKDTGEIDDSEIKIKFVPDMEFMITNELSKNNGNIIWSDGVNPDLYMNGKELLPYKGNFDRITKVITEY